MKNIYIGQFFSRIPAGLTKLIVAYAILDSILMLSVPVFTSLIVNNIIAHATISVITLTSILFVILFMAMVIKSIQEYLVEKFKQRLFVEKSIDIAEACLRCNESKELQKGVLYFFSVISLQKIFPKFILGAAALIVEIITGLVLLLFFNTLLFEIGFLMLIYSLVLVAMGKNGIYYSLQHSDLKYKTLFFLKEFCGTCETDEEKEKKLEGLDKLLNSYLDVRHGLFKVILRQKILSFFMVVLLYTVFFLVGSMLVIKGQIPIGEFIAAEIVVVYIGYSVYKIVKEIDFFYNTVEDFYKLGILEDILSIRKN